MRCEEARRTLSLAADGGLAPGRGERLEAHVAGCSGCNTFQLGVERVRRGLRLAPVGVVPDVAPEVVARLEQGSRRPGPLRRLAPVAAVFLAAAVVGAVLAGPGTRPPSAGAGIADQVLAAQHGVETLAARVTVVERGWHPDVPERTYAGRVQYRAPESLAVHLVDTTAYPPGAWVPNHVDAVVAEASAWASGPVPCPTEALPGCTPPEPRVVATTGREPFPGDGPLDLVVPVRSFLPGSGATPLSRDIAGRPSLGVTVLAAQVEPLLSGLLPAGNWREIHPTDAVELWLDRDYLVPVQVDVRAGTGEERSRWAAQRGYDDEGTLFRITFSDVQVNRPVSGEVFTPIPEAASPREDGFHDLSAGEVPIPEPAFLPAGMQAGRAGVLVTPEGPEVAVRAWTDGRAWVKVRLTRDWAGEQLFGDLAGAVRLVALPSAGLAYVGEGGGRVALHGAGVDLVVTGSLAEADLLAVADGLPFTGLRVPETWDEAAAVSVPDAAAALPGLLVPAGLAGFGPPAARVDGPAVTLSYTGPGSTGFVLVEAPGTALSPPADPDVRGVTVRSITGRYSFGRGELDWVEGGVVLSLRSATLGLDRLLEIAGTLR